MEKSVANFLNIVTPVKLLPWTKPPSIAQLIITLLAIMTPLCSLFSTVAFKLMMLLPLNIRKVLPFLAWDCSQHFCSWCASTL